MTMIIHFHQSEYRHFKGYYTKHVMVHLQSEFPQLVSYNRFVELMPDARLPLCLYLHSRFGAVTGISFVDSTPLVICHNRRIDRHGVFDGLAARGKTFMGWFYGFKLHLVVNEQGELLALYLAPGNVDDRKPVPHIAKKLWGKLFGDKGYISQIEHTRHRSTTNFLVNLVAGLIAYTHQKRKPSLNLSQSDLEMLPAII